MYDVVIRDFKLFNFRVELTSRLVTTYNIEDYEKAREKISEGKSVKAVGWYSGESKMTKTQDIERVFKGGDGKIYVVIEPQTFLKLIN